MGDDTLKNMKKLFESAALIAVITILLTFLLQLWTAHLEKVNRDRETLHQAHASLSGAKAKAREFLILMQDSQIHCHYRYRKCELDKKADEKAEDSAESNRQGIRSEDFRAEIARTNPDIFAAIGTIKVYCRKNDYIAKLADNAGKSVDLTLLSIPTGLDAEGLEIWKYEMTKKEAEVADAKYKPIDDLLTAVADKLAKEM